MSGRVQVHDDACSGHFTIEGESQEAVSSYLTEWMAGPEGPRLFKLRVIDAGRTHDGKPRVMIYFDYNLVSGGREPRSEQKKFIEKHTDLLRRRFGNGLVAWSVGSPVHDVYM